MSAAFLCSCAERCGVLPRAWRRPCGCWCERFVLSHGGVAAMILRCLLACYAKVRLDAWWEDRSKFAPLVFALHEGLVCHRGAFGTSSRIARFAFCPRYVVTHCDSQLLTINALAGALPWGP